MSGTTCEHHAGCSKSPDFSPTQPWRAKTRLVPSKAAASEEVRRTLRYVEPLSDARTLLADFFSILLRLRGPSKTRQHTLYRFLHHRILILEQRKQGGNGLLRPEPRERLGGIPPHKPVFILERFDQRADSSGIADLAQGFGRMAPYHPIIAQQSVDQRV